MEPTTSNFIITNAPEPVEEIEIESNIPLDTNENTHEITIEDAEVASCSSTLKNNPLDGWTKNEKYYLYKVIKQKGSKNLEAIQEYISDKTLEEIEAAIAHYKERANQQPDCTLRKSKARNFRTKPLIPLASWAKLLTDNRNYSELQTEIVTAFRLIADIGDIPCPTTTEQIDFRKVYHQIADAMEGKSLADDRLIAEVLSSCMLETALLSKQFINLSTFKNIVSSVSFEEKSVAVFPRPTKDCELTIIRHLAAQGNYNPLGISVDNLLPMSTSQNK